MIAEHFRPLLDAPAGAEKFCRVKVLQDPRFLTKFCNRSAWDHVSSHS